MTDDEIVRGYLKSLSRYLSRLEKADADEVIREIESHICDVLESREKAGQETNVGGLLSGFGEPRALAAQYVEHILEGTPPPKGFQAIQTVKRGASKGLYFGMVFFGYSISLALMAITLIKLIAPDWVGVWLSEHGQSVVIGVGANVLDRAPEGTTDLLSWWVIPVAIMLSVCIAYLTRRILTILKQRIP